MVTNRTSEVADRSVSVPMTLSDNERRHVSFFLADLHNYGRNRNIFGHSIIDRFNL